VSKKFKSKQNTDMDITGSTTVNTAIATYAAIAAAMAGAAVVSMLIPSFSLMAVGYFKRLYRKHVLGRKI